MAERNHSTNTPTTDDNPRNRLTECLKYAILEFSIRGSKVLLVSMDKNNSDAKFYENYLSKGIETSIGASGALVAGPVGFKVGKIAGKPVGFIATSKSSIVFPFFTLHGKNSLKTN